MGANIETAISAGMLIGNEMGNALVASYGSAFDGAGEQFISDSGKVVLDSQVETMVQAMAAFAPQAADHMALLPE